MKTCLTILLSACFAASVAAVERPPLQPTVKSGVFSLDYELILAPRVEAPNEITLDGITVSGVLPQAIKTKNLLQLINPAAPAQYWASDGNADRDFKTRQITGFNFLSIRF